MSDLVTRLRGGGEPVARLLGEAADALVADQARIAELTETLRAVVEMSNTQRTRDFAEVKRTLAKARDLLAAAASAPSPAPSVSAPRAGPESPASATPVPGAMPGSVASVAPAPPDAPADPAKTPPENDIVTGVFNEIRNFLRNPAEGTPRAR